MNETRGLRNTVARYAVLAAFAAEAVSLIFTKGFDAGFVYGLAVGTAVGIVNFGLLAFALNLSLSQKRAGAGMLFTLAFVLRLVIYGAAFLAAYQISLTAGVACLIGFITVKISIFFANFVKKSI